MRGVCRVEIFFRVSEYKDQIANLTSVKWGSSRIFGVPEQTPTTRYETPINSEEERGQ